jgi:hypothetical protein
MRLDPTQDRDCDDGLFSDISGCSDFGLGRYLLIDRSELRLHFAAGIYLGNDDGGATIAVATYTSLYDTTEDMLCVNCGYLNPVDFQEGWGIIIVIGGEFGEINPNPKKGPAYDPTNDPIYPPPPRETPPRNNTGTGDGRLPPPPGSGGTGGTGGDDTP